MNIFSDKLLEDARKELKKIIIEKSYKSGEFTLTSGKKSNFYFDGKQTTLHPFGAVYTGMIIMDMIIKHPVIIDAVGGMTLGSDPIVTAVSINSVINECPIPAFIIRKEAKGHGTGSYIEGAANLPDKCTVCLVEDTVTTAGTLIKAIKRVEDAGYNVGLLVTVVERQEGGKEALAALGYDLKSIFTKSDFTKDV